MQISSNYTNHIAISISVKIIIIRYSFEIVQPYSELWTLLCSQPKQLETQYPDFMMVSVMLNINIKHFLNSF